MRNRHPDPDPLVRGMDPRIQIRIRIHTKMPWIRNTGYNYKKYTGINLVLGSADLQAVWSAVRPY
jgi:hypothetical protein